MKYVPAQYQTLTDNPDKSGDPDNLKIKDNPMKFTLMACVLKYTDLSKVKI
jgi:hypothetical protein